VSTLVTEKKDRKDLRPSRVHHHSINPGYAYGMERGLTTLLRKLKNAIFPHTALQLLNNREITAEERNHTADGLPTLAIGRSRQISGSVRACVVICRRRESIIALLQI